MRPESFFHVAVKVEDLERAAGFFETFFNGTVVARGSAEESEDAAAVEYVALRVADKRVYLFEQAPYEATGHTDELPVGFLHFGFFVPDVEAAYEELVDAGVEFVMEPTAFGDLKIAFLAGPGGVRIELLERAS